MDEINKECDCTQVVINTSCCKVENSGGAGNNSLHYDVLFEGKADTIDIEYLLSAPITDYKALVFELSITHMVEAVSQEIILNPCIGSELEQRYYFRDLLTYYENFIFNGKKVKGRCHLSWYFPDKDKFKMSGVIGGISEDGTEVGDPHVRKVYGIK